MVQFDANPERFDSVKMLSILEENVKLEEIENCENNEYYENHENFESAENYENNQNYENDEQCDFNDPSINPEYENMLPTIKTENVNAMDSNDLLGPTEIKLEEPDQYEEFTNIETSEHLSSNPLVW